MGKSLFEFASLEKEQKTKVYNEKAIKEQLDKYSKLSESELSNKLFSEVQKQKQNGQFDFSAIVNKVEELKPMLSSEQIQKIENLLRKIK